MGMNTTEVVVGGRKFHISQLPARRAQTLFNRLCRIGLPSLAKAVASSGATSISGMLKSGIAGVADGLRELVDKLDPVEQDAILADLFHGARIQYNDKFMDLAPVYDEVFAGRIDEIYLLAFEALKLNYSSFWRALNAAISAGKSEAAAEK
jgi:hypothetical protein